MLRLARGTGSLLPNGRAHPMEKQVLNTRLNCTLHICVTSFNRTLIIFRPYIYRLLNQRLSRNRFITWFVNCTFIHPIFNLPKVLPFFSFISNVLLSVILFFILYILYKYFFRCVNTCIMLLAKNIVEWKKRGMIEQRIFVVGKKSRVLFDGC